MTIKQVQVVPGAGIEIHPIRSVELARERLDLPFQWHVQRVKETQFAPVVLLNHAQNLSAAGAKSPEYARQASNLLAGLEQKWHSDSYSTYLARPDIQYARSQLARLAGGR